MNSLKNANAIIIDDHSIFAESLSSILEKFKIFDSVFILKGEEDLREHFMHKNIYDHSETIVFLDYYLPQKNGLNIIKELRIINRKAKVIFLSSVTNLMVINKMLQAKPDAIVNKTEGIEQLLEALKHIAKKQQYLSVFTRQILESQTVLTTAISNREIEILSLFATGASIQKIADALYLSPLTIMAHKRNMMKKTQSKSILELIAFGRKNGLID